MVFTQTLSKCALLPALCSVAMAVDPVPTGAPGERPNVVLIICDDLNASIGHLGDPQARTPRIDALAATGVSFRRAYCNNPVCAPSRASFLTGISPQTSGNFFFDPWYENTVLANSRTLMEHFRQNGYRVVGTGKIMHHERPGDWDEFGPPPDHGPMAFDGRLRVAHPSVPEPFRKIGPMDGSFGPLVPSPGGTSGQGWISGIADIPWRCTSDTDRDPTPDESCARWTAERIRRFAREDGSQPFFLAVGFMRPHTPLHAPKAYFDLFPTDNLRVPPIKDGDAGDTHYRDVYTENAKGLRYWRALSDSFPTPEAARKAYLQAYLACVAALDDCVGQVIEAVDRSPFRDRTIIAFTSDNGWINGEKDFLFKNALWEGSVRVPLIIRAPGVAKPGGLAEHPAGLIDLFPTLLDLCRLPGETRKNDKGKPLDGHSLRPFLVDPLAREWAGPDFALSMIYAGEDARSPQRQMDLRDPASHHWSIRDARWRYIRYANGAEELYDHDSDPNEWTNLARQPAQDGVRANLRGKLASAIDAGRRGDDAK